MKKTERKEKPVETPVENPVEEVEEADFPILPEVKAEEAKENPAKTIATNWQRIKSHVRRFVRKHFLAIQITEAAIVFAAFCTLLCRWKAR